MAVPSHVHTYPDPTKPFRRRLHRRTTGVATARVISWVLAFRSPEGVIFDPTPFRTTIRHDRAIAAAADGARHILLRPRHVTALPAWPVGVDMGCADTRRHSTLLLVALVL